MCSSRWKSDYRNNFSWCKWVKSIQSSSDWCLYTQVSPTLFWEHKVMWIRRKPIIFAVWFCRQSHKWHKDLTEEYFLNAVFPTCKFVTTLCANINPGSKERILLTVILWSVSSPLFCHWQNVQYCRQPKHLQCQHPGGKRLSEVIKDAMKWLGKCQWMAARHSSSLILPANASQGYFWQRRMHHLPNCYKTHQQLTQTLISFWKSKCNHIRREHQWCVGW